MLLILGCNSPTDLTGPMAASKQEFNTQEAIEDELKMVLIPAGTFTMGAPDSEDPGNTVPQHEVTLTTSYYLSAYEITNEQFDIVMGPGSRQGPKGEPNAPVTMLTWESAVKFCEKLSELPAAKAAGKTYRLPTEAEWEYACRAGSTAAYCFGDSPKQLGEYAWFSDNYREGNPALELRAVGLKNPNAWGLYDMHGNVNEYCQDIEADYPVGPVIDPHGPKDKDGYGRVVRGGHRGSRAEECRCAFRNLGGNTNFTGFRVAMSLADQLKPVKAVQQVQLVDFDLSSQLDHQPQGGALLPERRLDYKAIKESFYHVAALMASGADPNTKSAEGTPLLFYAIDDSDAEVRTTTANWQQDDQEQQMRKLPVRTHGEPIPRRLEALLKAGADPNICDQHGQSPLHYAIVNQRSEAIKLLYDYGADINKPVASGTSPIEFEKQKNYNSRVTLQKLIEENRERKVGKRVSPPRTVRTPDLQLGSTLFRPAAGGAAITYSADGKQIIAGETQHVLRVFDAATGVRVSAISTNFDYLSNHYIWSLTTIPQSRIVIASGGIGYPLRFWNIDSGVEVMRLACNCTHASVSPDGKLLFTGDYLCRIESLEPLKLAASAREFRGGADQKIQVRASFFTSDSRYLIFLDDQSYRVWDLTNDEVVPIKSFNPKSPRPITWGDLAQAVKIDAGKSPTDIIAVSGNAFGFQVGDAKVLKTTQSLLTKLANNKNYRAFATSPDGRFLAALGFASRIDIFDLQKQGEQVSEVGHTDNLLAIAASPDGKLIASGGNDGQVILWEQANGKLKRTIPIKAFVYSLCFSADSATLAIGAQDGGLHIHDVSLGKMKKWEFPGPVTGLRFANNQNAFIVLAGNLELRDAKSGKLLSAVPAGAAKSGKISYSQNGLIVGSSIPRDGEVSRSAWRIERDKLVADPLMFGENPNEEVYLNTTQSVGISRDGKLAATQAIWGIRLWDLEKREALDDRFGRYWASALPVNDIDFTFDGKYLAAGCHDGTARVWDVATGEQRIVFDADAGNIADIEFQSDGRLITANGDGTVHVWDVPKHLEN
jgi:formylglycine-generating enzyme required for sulfatase activity/WD40 repeat protein